MAQKIAAVNTILLTDRGELSGYNTDYAAALDAITAALAIDRTDLKNMPAAVVGAGGVARAVTAEVLAEKVEQGYLKEEEAAPLMDRILYHNGKELFSGHRKA